MHLSVCACFSHLLPSLPEVSSEGMIVIQCVCVSLHPAFLFWLLLYFLSAYSKDSRPSQLLQKVIFSQQMSFFLLLKSSKSLWHAKTYTFQNAMLIYFEGIKMVEQVKIYMWGSSLLFFVHQLLLQCKDSYLYQSFSSWYSSANYNWPCFETSSRQTAVKAQSVHLCQSPFIFNHSYQQLKVSCYI